METGKPSGTALRVATVRASHRLLDHPIVFDDPLALTILGPEAEAAMHADPARHNDPMSRGCGEPLWCAVASPRRRWLAPSPQAYGNMSC